MKKIFLLYLIFSTTVVNAAIPQSKLKTEKYENALTALKLPYRNRIQALSDIKSFSELKRISANKKMSLQARWRAILALGEIYPQESLPVLEKFMKSREWFVRNSSILAMAKASRERGLFWAEKMLFDKALVVRTAAVKVIDDLDGISLSPVLWQQLNSSLNYKNGQSLWVRRYMVRTLGKFAHKGQAVKFAHLLNDKDPRVHLETIKVLQSLTGKNFEAKKSIKAKRLAWLKHYKIN